MQLTISSGSEDTYPLIFGDIATIGEMIADIAQLSGGHAEKCIVVTDENVSELYSSEIIPLIEAHINSVVFTIPSGEPSKSLSILSDLYDGILTEGIDRSTPIVALGGGVVGDLAGFVAATVLRGVPLIHIPTTLTAQVDSSIGGKTGINHSIGKNLIGSFYPPKAILSDTRFLQTLSEREWRSGLAEVVKHAYIDSSEHYASLLNDFDAILKREQSIVDSMVPASAAVKARIVQLDEKEGGVRMWLNLGHTTGHAIERVATYGSFSHGEAVAAGLAIAIECSKLRGFSIPDELAYTLLLSMDIGRELMSLNPDEIFAASISDKKKVGNTVRFVLLQDIGSPVIDSSIDPSIFTEAWSRMLGRISY